MANAVHRLTRGLKPAAAFATFTSIRQAYWMPSFGLLEARLTMPGSCEPKFAMLLQRVSGDVAVM